MSKARLFVVGDMNVDIIQETARRPGQSSQSSQSSQPAFGEEHVIGGLEFTIGGGAANLAVIAGKMGMEPVLVSAIGSDFATRSLKRKLKESNVRASLIESRKKNAFSVVCVNKRGERSIQSVSNCLDEVTAGRAGSRLLSSIAPGDVVFFSGFYQLRNLRPGFRDLLASIRKKKATVCFDTSFDMYGKWTISPFIRFIDCLFVNETELRHIAKGSGSSLQAKASFLLKRGAGTVVLKQGARGATVFEGNMKPIEVKAVRDGTAKRAKRAKTAKASKAIDTTGAGDAFNAGFVFGLMRSWSLQNCALAGNLVAARSIRQHGPAAPSARAVGRFIAKHNRPVIIIEPGYNEMSSAAAEIVTRLLRQKPDASIVLPTGETPKQLYKILARQCKNKSKEKRISFSKARLFQLDEYVGPKKMQRGSFSYFLDRHLLSGKKTRAKKKNIHYLNGSAKDLRKECARHEAAVKKHGIDLCILGIAPNGHVGFNEPGSSPSSVTRVVKLKPETIEKNAGYFPGIEVPKKGITMGLGTIRYNCRQILLLASGSSKSAAIRASLSSNNQKKWPAVALRKHKNLTFVLDRAAYGKKP